MTTVTTTDTEVVNILCWAWDDYPRIYTLPKRTAHRFSFFRTAKVGRHFSKEMTREIPVIKVRDVTACAMSLFLDFIKTGEIPTKNLEDSYFWDALPDLYTFIKNHIREDEFFSCFIYKLNIAICEKIFYAISRPEITDAETVHDMKLLIIKNNEKIPEEYEKYF